jgi:RND family efflux transporter MFP subunit
MGKKQIIIPLVILTIGIGSYFFFSSLNKPPEEKIEVDNTPIVTVEKISVETMTMNVDSYGVVKPKYETELVAQVNGQIVELSEVFVRGSFVKKGQLLARIDPNDYRAALIEAQSSMASAKAALKTEVAQGKVAEQEWKQITSSSPTELSLRKPQLAQELARVKSAQASILRAERNLERTKIVAPYDAMIDSRNIGLGSFVGVGSNIGKLFNTDLAEIRLPVADNQLQFLIDRGINAVVKLQGIYASENVEWPANIVRSEGVIDDKSRMSYLVAEVKDPYNLNAKSDIPPLRYGSYITASIAGITIDGATTVPRYLVDNGRVAILDKSSKLHFANIEIVRQNGKNVIVGNGLLEGDQLIVSALDYPIEGMKLGLVGDKFELNNADELGKGNQVTQVEHNSNGLRSN